MTKRSIHSDSDFRNRLNTGSLEVRGYTGEFLLYIYIKPCHLWYIQQLHTCFEHFGKVIQGANDAVEIYSLVGVDRVIAPTRTENEVISSARADSGDC